MKDTKVLKRSDLASTSVVESEVTVNLDKLNGNAGICSCWPSRTMRLYKKYGYPHEVSMVNGKIGSAFWTLPIKVITFRNLPKD